MKVPIGKVAIITGSAAVLISTIFLANVSFATSDPQEVSKSVIPSSSPNARSTPKAQTIRATSNPKISDTDSERKMAISSLAIEMQGVVGEATWKKLIDSGFEVTTVSRFDSQFCISKNNDDGMAEEIACYDEATRTMSTENIDYVPKFGGSQAILDALQKTTSQEIDRYSSIFQNGDSYCFNLESTFHCYDPLTDELFTQTWYRDGTGHKILGDPRPFSDSGNN
jgi:hypothetical protein